MLEALTLPAPHPQTPTLSEVRNDPLSALFLAISISFELEEHGDLAGAVGVLERVNDQVEAQTDNSSFQEQ